MRQADFSGGGDDSLLSFRASLQSERDSFDGQILMDAVRLRRVAGIAYRREERWRVAVDFGRDDAAAVALRLIDDFRRGDRNRWTLTGESVRVARESLPGGEAKAGPSSPTAPSTRVRRSLEPPDCERPWERAGLEAIAALAATRPARENISLRLVRRWSPAD